MNRKRLAAALAYVDEKAKRLTSLDQPKESDAVDMALEMGGSFIPGVGQALAARDFERARRADDDAGMAMAAASALPVGRLIGALKGFDPVMREIDVYHGSPHRFEEFDASKIGTGEGAQAYGHGIYFAESPDVAKQYKKASDLTPEELEKQLKYALYKAETSNDPLIRDAFKNAAAQLKQSGGKQGSLYTADLPDEMVDRMLDWDKPLSKDAPQAVKDAFNKLAQTYPKLKEKLFSAYREGKPGSHYYSLLNDYAKTGDLVKNQTFASDAMRQAGIPGIRYLDAGSRGQGGSGTRNFVVFPGEEKKVKILKRE